MHNPGAAEVDSGASPASWPSVAVTFWCGRIWIGIISKIHFRWTVPCWDSPPECVLGYLLIGPSFWMFTGVRSNEDGMVGGESTTLSVSGAGISQKTCHVHPDISIPSILYCWCVCGFWLLSCYSLATPFPSLFLKGSSAPEAQKFRFYLDDEMWTSVPQPSGSNCTC